MKQNLFQTQETTEQIQSTVKVPKTNRIKLIRELNYKSNLNSQDGKSNSNNKSISGQNMDALIGKCRSRAQNSLTTQNSNSSAIARPNHKDRCSKRNKLDGQVQFFDENGNRFKGIYKNGIRIQGKMIYCRARCSYEGSFLGQNFHGHGKLTYFDGRTIEGQWEQHFLIGNSIINYPNGEVYYGDVNEKLYKHGKGHLFLANGDKYIGDFMNGSITGYGVFYKGANIIVEGQWMQGQLIKQRKSEQLQEQRQLEDNNPYSNAQISETTSIMKNERHLNEFICSPLRSNLRLMTQYSTKSRQLTQPDVSNEQMIGLVRTRKM